MDQPYQYAAHSAALNLRQKQNSARNAVHLSLGKFQVPRFKFHIPNPQPPSAYTPAHLAERILAEREAMAARGATDGERKTITALR